MVTIDFSTRKLIKCSRLFPRTVLLLSFRKRVILSMRRFRRKNIILVSGTPLLLRYKMSIHFRGWSWGSLWRHLGGYFMFHSLLHRLNWSLSASDWLLFNMILFSCWFLPTWRKLSFYDLMFLYIVLNDFCFI